MASSDSRRRGPSRLVATGKFSPPARAMTSSRPGTPAGAPGPESSSFDTAPTVTPPSIDLARLVCGHPAPEGHQREAQAVEVVVDVEVAGEARARVLGLVPGPILALIGHQPRQAALDGLRASAEGVWRHQRPCRLGRGAGAAADPLWILVGAAVLAPAPVGVLDPLEPGG